MRKLVLPALLLAQVVLLSQVAQADVYCKREAQGQMQCSDRPMPGAERVSTTARIPTSNDAAATAERERLKTSQGQTQAAQTKEATQQTVQQDVAGARAEQCKQAQDRYAKAVRARRMFHVNAQGEREYLSETDADAARVAAKSGVEEACGAK